MKKASRNRKTTVGHIDADVLEYTAAHDVQLDLALVQVDCAGTAAHVKMLARMPLKKKVLTGGQAKAVIAELVNIMRHAARGRFRVTLKDQDVHLAVERALTEKLGEVGKRVHTARSRNDQVAVDLRLFAKEKLLETVDTGAELAQVLIKFARKHAAVPMVGRTHMQPAMPSSVGLWAAAHAESLLDDLTGLLHVHELNDQCPLGAAAGFGVPLPIDRQLVSDLLGFSRPCHTVLYAGNARGKLEAAILAALSQVMISLSRLAQDLILYTMPEFSYFTYPPAFGTGSSIMPQKNNPDVLELLRARAAMVGANAFAVGELVRSLPGGYHRDLQETKKPFMDGLDTTLASLQVMTRLTRGLKVNRQALLDGFSAGVFATDEVMARVGEGVPFRDAYHAVKANLTELEGADPAQAVARKTHLGATAGIDYDLLAGRARAAKEFAREGQRAHHKAISKLLGVAYPVSV